MSNTGNAVPTAAGALPDPDDAPNVAYNPPLSHLRNCSARLETTTEFGSASYVSDQRSRSAAWTKNAVDDDFGPADRAYMIDALDYARTHEMICVDRRVGRHPDHSYVCRFYVPREYGRIALALVKLLEPAPADAPPDFLTVQVPDWDEVAIRVHPARGVTTVLGSDYSGEAKKSFLRLFMWQAKRHGGIGLHAGSKRVTIRRRDGDVARVGQMFLGLSATGKSTLTAHDLWLEAPESASMLQDDVCALLPDGRVVGSEGNGLYVKTAGLDADEQPSVYDAVTHDSAVLENVAVDPDGTVDFESAEYTTNGRAVILRDHLSSADEDVDLDRVEQVFFITRNPAMPLVAKLSTEQAAVAFMLGESIQTSAGDPSSAGEPIRVVGTNPFIVGSEGEEGNRFRDLVADLDVACFVLNTGHVGDGGPDIGVETTVTVLREIARGTVEWTEDEWTGLTVPESVPGLDVGPYAIADTLADHERVLRELRAERRAYLETFDDLDDAIVDAVY